MRYLVVLGALLLGACVTTADQGAGVGPVAAAPPQAPPPPPYVRPNGKTNFDQMRLALAQCQGEAAATPQGFWLDGGGLMGLAANVALRAGQDQTVTSACMARFGYVENRHAQ